MSFDMKLAAGITIGLFMMFAINMFLDLLRARKTNKELTMEPCSQQIERGRVFARNILKSYPITGRETLQEMLDRPTVYANAPGFNQGIREILKEEK